MLLELISYFEEVGYKANVLKIDKQSEKNSVLAFG